MTVKKKPIKKEVKQRKEPFGRPTKYNDKILVDTKIYIDGAYEISGEVIPTIAGLSLFLELCEDTLHVWKKEEGKENFSLLIKELKAKQKSILISKGLLGDFNSTIAKLILHKHGYSDKKDVTVSVHEQDLEELA